MVSSLTSTQQSSSKMVLFTPLLNTISSPKNSKVIHTNLKSSKHPNLMMRSKWVKPDKSLSEKTGKKPSKKSCTGALLSSSIKIQTSNNNSLQLVTEKSSSTQQTTVTGVMDWEREKIVSVSFSWN